MGLEELLKRSRIDSHFAQKLDYILVDRPYRQVLLD